MCAHDVNPLRRARRRISNFSARRGFTLIEMMVGLVVALLVVLAAIGSSQFFMGRQRGAVDTDSAASNETNGLAAIKYEVAHAGLGFYADGRALCPTMNLSQGMGVFASNTAMSPLDIRLGADGVTVDVLYGSTLEAVSPALLSAATSSGDTSISVASYLPVAAGQTLMLVPGVGSTAPCTVRTATAVTPATDTSPLTFGVDATGSANQVAFPTVAYATTDFVTQLGRLQWSRFRLVGGTLLMERPLAGGSAVMARNVVAFVAEYGVADASGTSVGTWHKATDDYAVLDATHLATVRALRVGLVVRSEQPDKKDATGHCVATASLPTVFGDPLAASDPDWACYRYRVGTVVVPLRNIVMGSAG